MIFGRGSEVLGKVFDLESKKTAGGDPSNGSKSMKRREGGFFN